MHQPRSLGSCFGRIAIATLMFLSGAFVGASAALISNREHDEKIRDEVWRDAIDKGAAWIEINPVSGYEHYRWITEKPLFPQER